jgi:hypothetical protein
MKSEQKRLLVISLVIVLGVCFFAFGEEMASITFGNSTGYLRAVTGENITVSYDLPGVSGVSHCIISCWYMPENSNSLDDDSVAVGEYRHSGSGRMVGSFPAFKIHALGDYRLKIECEYHYSNGSSFSSTKTAVLNITQGNAGNGSSGGNSGGGNVAGGNNGTGNGSSGGAWIEVIPAGGGNGSDGKNSGDGNGIEIIQVNHDYDFDSDPDLSEGDLHKDNSSDESVNAHKVHDFVVPKNLKEFFENMFRNLWAILTGELSLMDILKALIDAVVDVINNRFDWEALLKLIFYALILIIVIAVAVSGVYLILKLVILKYMKKRRNV